MQFKAHNPFLCSSLLAFAVHIRQSASLAWAAGLDSEGVSEGGANGLQRRLESAGHALEWLSNASKITRCDQSLSTVENQGACDGACKHLRDGCRRR